MMLVSALPLWAEAKKDETVFFYPEYAMLPHLFYQGNRILVSSVVIPDGSAIWLKC